MRWGVTGSNVLRCAVLWVVVAGRLGAAEGTSAASPATAGASNDELYRLGQQLFDQYAPDEVKAEYEFPSKEQWDAFANQLSTVLQADSLEDLARSAPQARAALRAVRAAGIDDDLADWLEQRLDEVEGAGQATGATPSRPTPPRRPPPPGPPSSPLPPKPTPSSARVPYYELWLGRVKDRPMPARASSLLPALQRAFVAEGVPPSLAWLAEAESSFNPSARSPAGAKGLFQLMPDTAKRLGLGTFLPDDRTNPEKSAHAAAHYLRELHDKFGQWPLALAAYNAGEGRVTRALAARHAKDYASIAESLPAETRMYVPKVCALVAVRSGTALASM